jgi:hypothetical protein
MTCIGCQREIPPARLAAAPNTHLCVGCKARCDEQPLTRHSPALRRVMVESSLSDCDEMSRESRQLVRGE